MTTTTQPNTKLSETEALREDLELTRQHLADTVQELSRQLNVPRRIKDSATSAFQTAGHRAKQAAGGASERAKLAAGSAGERARQLPQKAKQVPELTRKHPRAAAAVGGAAAFAVGATAWIMGRSK